MSKVSIIIISLVYLGVIFFAAYASERSDKIRERISRSSLIYALSLCVYCTAWTFYGSIGQASATGLGFLGVYLGPTLIAPIWLFFLKKIIRISKYLRITSIADFVSSRYGKSTSIGVMVSLLCLFIVIPYISIQLKALEFSYNFLHFRSFASPSQEVEGSFYNDPSMLFVLIFAGFAIFFGTRKIDPSEKHTGLVSVVALESIIKLVCFLIAAIVIIYSVFEGVEDVFSKFGNENEIKKLAYLNNEGIDYGSWFWVLVLSAFAFLFLPRQFHMAVVENNGVRHIKKATWITPLYLFLISIFVLPVAFAGKILLNDSVDADTYLLNIPVHQELWTIAVIVFIGGLAAISGMIMTSMISLSIMISNNIFLPILLRAKNQFEYFLGDMNTRLLQLRRILILFVMFLSYGFYKAFTVNYSIVSVGLISFAGIAQLAPMILLGLYWKFVTEKGVKIGFVVGVAIWAYTLPFANMAELGIFSPTILKEGMLGFSWLRPTALLDVEGMSVIAHGSFWSLSMNLIVTVLVSLYTERSPLEITQSDIFLNPEKYYKSIGPTAISIERKAVFSELKNMLIDILGKVKVNELLTTYYVDNKMSKDPQFADSKLINFIENHLSGSIGTASANIVLNKLVQQKPVNTEELVKLLDQTYQVYQNSQLLEQKSQELKSKTEQLKKANEQLQYVDILKNEFISNVTHELRTPITSIRSIAGILSAYKVSAEEKEKFLKIINEESERVSNLVNQVLDLRKLQVQPELDKSVFDLKKEIENIVLSFSEIKDKRNIKIQGDRIELYTDLARLKQILVNLLSNAIKFTDSETGEINIRWQLKNDRIIVSVIDNGVGICDEHLELIFERFYQVNSGNVNKSKGSGLGLSISRTLAETMGGMLIAESKVGVGTTFILKLDLEKE